jgi:hypothetical protein
MTWSGKMRNEWSENILERSLELQERIDRGHKAVKEMNIKDLLNLSLIDRNTYRKWDRYESEQDELSEYSDFTPSMTHYEDPIEMAMKNLKRLEIEVKSMIDKSRATKRYASKRVAAKYMRLAGSGADNAMYLKSLPLEKKTKILKHIADHYGVSVSEIEEELVDPDAEKLFEYAATNPTMAREIYNDFKRMRLANTKTAASGNYGFTKRVQNDVEVAIRKLEKKVNQLARRVESKHPEAGAYFGTRCQGSSCNASKALSSACVLNQQPKRTLTGPLGFKPSCAKASHNAITSLILYSGEVAHSLHSKDRDHVPYLQTHAKKKRCPLTKLLLENYPVEIV